MNEDCEILSMDDIKYTSDDLFNVSATVYDEMKLKLAFLLFIMFIILNTDIFAENILSKISKSNYDNSIDKITDKGIFTSGIILASTYVFLDILDKKKII